jgi:3-deoxy-D-arabino-heptulosonate 7-phosphate (DAHP) synthase class II
MNTKIWDPENKKKSNIDNGLLDQFIQIVRNCEESNIKNHLTDVEKNKFYILRLCDDIWLQSLNDFDNAELLDLIKFFTLIEMQLDDWISGENSPVIKINKILKKRGIKLDQQMLLWIKKNSSNRYIPNGKIL